MAWLTLVYRVGEQPRRSEHRVERDHGRSAGRLTQQIVQDFHEIVGLDGAARYAHDRQSARRRPGPAEIVRQTHTPRWIASHGVDAAVGRAGACADHRPRPRCEPVDPFAGGDRLAAHWIGPDGGPVALGFVPFVRDGALDDEDEWAELTRGGTLEDTHEVAADLVGQDGIVQVDLRQPGQRTAQHVLDARVGGRRHGDGVAVAPQPRGQPDDMHLGDLGVPLHAPPRDHLTLMPAET